MNRNVIEILITARDQATQVLKANAKQLVELGTAITIGTAAITAGIAASTASAVTYEETMANTAAVLNLTREAQAQLSQELLDFGKDTRAGPQAVAAAFYDIAGGVADASTHMAVLEAATRTAEAGNASLGATTSALIGVMNSFRFSAEEAAFASNVMTQTVGKGVGTMEQLASALPLVAGKAAALGVSFDQLGAMMSFVSQKGFSFSQSATTIQGMMQALIVPSETMKRLFAEIGVASGEAAIRQLGVAGTYQALTAAAERSGVSLAAAVGQAEAYNGVLAFTGANANAANEALAGFTVGLENATEAARAIQMESAAAQLDLLKSSLSAIKIEVGEALLPVINNIVAAVRPFLDQLFQWMQANPQLTTTIIAMLGVVSAIGPIMTAAGLATQFFNSAMTALSGPFGLVIKLGTLLAFALITNFGGVRDLFVNSLFPVLGAFGELFGALFNALKPLLEALSKLFSDTLGAILTMLKPFIDVLVGVIKIVTGFIKLLTGDAVGAMKSFSEGFGVQMPVPPAVQAQQAAQQRAMDFYQQQSRTAGAGAIPALSSGIMPPTPLPAGLPATLPGFGGVTYSDPMAQYQAALRQNGNTYNLNVQMPDSAVGGGFAARQAGQDFGTALNDELRRLG